MSESNFSIRVQASKPMNIRVSPSYIVKPAYRMVGVNAKSSGGIQGYDLINAMLEFTGDMRWMFKLLMDGLNQENNCCSLKQLKEFRANKVRVSIAYKQLSKIDLVKRMGVGLYMINPRAIIPPKTYPEAQRLWDSKPNKNLIDSPTEELSNE